MNNNFNPYFNPYRPSEQLYQPMQQNIQPTYQQPIIKSGLQGKQVDSLEVVKATDIPMDGTISYFPIVDGSAIVSKQLTSDGTSRLIVYKPTNEGESVKYLTNKDIEDIREDILDIKRQIKDYKGKKGTD